VIGHLFLEGYLDWNVGVSRSLCGIVHFKKYKRDIIYIFNFNFIYGSLQSYYKIEVLLILNQSGKLFIMMVVIITVGVIVVWLRERK